MNLERIVALKPDLVLAWRGGNTERQVNQLTSLGIKVMWVDAVSIEQVAQALRALAPYSPTPAKAEDAAKQLLSDYAALKAKYDTPVKKRIFLQFGSQPLFTTGKGSIQNQVWKCAAEKISLRPAGYRGLRSAGNRYWLADHRRSLWSEMRARFLKLNNSGKAS